MEIDVFQQFEETVQAFGLPYHKYQAQETVENEAERRLCKILGTEPEIGKTAEEILKLTNTRDMECYFYTVQA